MHNKIKNEILGAKTDEEIRNLFRKYEKEITVEMLNDKEIQQHTSKYMRLTEEERNYNLYLKNKKH